MPLTGRHHLLAFYARAGVAIILLGVAAGHVRAAEISPSFSCAKATAPVDRAICADETLAELDRTLETAFRAELRRDPDEKAKLLDDQRYWLAARGPTCNPPAGAVTPTSIACLTDLYRARLHVLAATGSQPYAPLCQAVAGAIRAIGVPQTEYTLASILTVMPNSPVRFSPKDETMTPALLARLPHQDELQADELKNAQVHWFGPSHSFIAVETIGGTMHCQRMAFFKLEAGVPNTIDSPMTRGDGDYCWNVKALVGNTTETTTKSTPLFAVENDAIDHAALTMTARVDGTWRPACEIDSTYETALAKLEHICAPEAPCAALEDLALNLARQRDAASPDTPPQTLGGFKMVDEPALAGGDTLSIFDNGQKYTGGFSNFADDALLYAGQGPQGPITVRIGHGTMGWRTNDDYLVKFYKRDGKNFKPLASFLIEKSRVGLKDVAVRSLTPPETPAPRH